jgi:hypothetical protein
MIVNSPPISQNSSLATNRAAEPADLNTHLNTRQLDTEVKRIIHLERSLKQDLQEPGIQDKKDLHENLDQNLLTATKVSVKNLDKPKGFAEAFLDKALPLMTYGA